MISFIGIGVVIATMIAILDEFKPHYVLRVLIIWSSIGLASASFSAWVLLVTAYVILLYYKHQKL